MSLAKDPGGYIKPFVIFADESLAAGGSHADQATAVVDTQPDTGSNLTYSSISFYVSYTVGSAEAATTFSITDVDIVEGATSSPATAVDSNLEPVEAGTVHADGNYFQRIATYDLAGRERYMKLSFDAALSSEDAEVVTNLCIIAVLAGPNKGPIDTALAS